MCTCTFNVCSTISRKKNYHNTCADNKCTIKKKREREREIKHTLSKIMSQLFLYYLHLFLQPLKVRPDERHVLKRNSKVPKHPEKEQHSRHRPKGVRGPMERNRENLISDLYL